MANLSLLLVEDEKPLLALLKKYLERLGHTVDTAETGQAALEKCRQTPCPFQIIVLDLTLPDMSGLDMLPELLNIPAPLRVVVSSGTVFSSEILPPHQRDRVGSLLKPYMPKELLEALGVASIEQSA
ncbi:MAG TPA: response regulator [Paludibaculum sp.]|jgi:CheY-like chemotaxis protein